MRVQERNGPFVRIPRGARARRAPRTIAEGERVSLRHPLKDDREEFLHVRRASRTFLESWEATPSDDADPFEDASFDRLLKSARARGSKRFLIVARGDGRLVGGISLGGIMRGAFQSAFVGYWIAHAEARKGYATEALRLALSLAFDRYGLHRVEANIVPTNEASRGLARKVGLRYEGLALRYLRINHAWRDHEHWAITAEEWGALVGASRVDRGVG